jgi:hypothetical protein
MAAEKSGLPLPIKMRASRQKPQQGFGFSGLQISHPKRAKAAAPRFVNSGKIPAVICQN